MNKRIRNLIIRDSFVRRQSKGQNVRRWALSMRRFHVVTQKAQENSLVSCLNNRAHLFFFRRSSLKFTLRLGEGAHYSRRIFDVFY